MTKKKTLDKFMTTKLNIKNTKGKEVFLPTGEKVVIPRLGYRHFKEIKSRQNSPEDIMNFIIDDIKPRDITLAESEFLLIHLYHHNNPDYADTLKTIGIDLKDLQITQAQYDYTFDNIRMVFDKPSILNQHLPFLIKEAYVDGQPVELTEDARFDLINSLYRFEFDAVHAGVIQTVYIVHEGKTIKGLNIIGD